MKNITLCHPRLQYLAQRLMEDCSKQGLKVKIGETRTIYTPRDERNLLQ